MNNTHSSRPLTDHEARKVRVVNFTVNGRPGTVTGLFVDHDPSAWRSIYVVSAGRVWTDIYRIPESATFISAERG